MLPQKVLEEYISGYHSYVLEEPFELEEVSGNLCLLLGCSREDLLHGGYERAVHPQDRPLYQDFLRSVAGKEQPETAQYRLFRQDGSILHVSDAMTPARGKDGRLRGHSVLTDITAVCRENQRLHTVNDIVPCGIIMYSCEPYPRVTFINEQMRKFLRCEEDSFFLLQGRENIYLQLPPEERRHFQDLLRRVSQSNEPIAGEITVFRSDGSRARLYGWISKCKNQTGEDEFQSVCMDITEKYRHKQEKERKQYEKVLSQVYEEIFELDFQKKSLCCLHGSGFTDGRKLTGIPMLLEESINNWMDHQVHPEDREKISRCFAQLCQRQGDMGDDRPLQIEFRTVAKDAPSGFKSYLGIFLQTGAHNGLFCCRNMSGQQLNDQLQRENNSLRSINEQMQELVMQFTDGMLAFEIHDGNVRPLYISDNICRFFGYSREEWLAAMNTLQPIQTFVSRSGIAYEDFLRLLQTHEAEFSYQDRRSGERKKVKAICTQSSGENCYVLLYDLSQKLQEQAPASVYVRTFGYFDVFVDGNPIAFRNEKSKELFALLVDRRGGFISSSEAISFLWENEPVNSVTLARYRKVALRLKNLLEEYGIASVMEAVDGKRRIVPEKIQCDLYDYLSHDPQYEPLFKGSYLLNYSWGENTLTELLGEKV